MTKMTAETQYKTHGSLNNPVRRTRYNKPAERHGRDNHNEETLSMVRQIRLGQFNPNSEKTGSEGNSCNLKCYHIDVSAPRAGIEDVGAVRAEDDSTRGTKDDFVDVKL